MFPDLLINHFLSFFSFFFIYIKLPENLWAKYYQDNKERLQKMLVKDISKKEKEKKQQYGCERYKNLNLPED